MNDIDYTLDARRRAKGNASRLHSEDLRKRLESALAAKLADPTQDAGRNIQDFINNANAVQLQILQARTGVE